MLWVKFEPISVDMASNTPLSDAEKKPIDISTDATDSEPSSSDGEFEAELSSRACDREDAATAYKEAVSRAQAEYAAFKKQAKRESDLDKIALAVKKRKKKVDRKGKAARKGIVKGKSAGDESVCDKPETATKELNPDQRFALSANKIAKVVLEVMVAEGVVDGPVLDTLNELDNEEAPPIHPVTHEEQLLLTCVPEQLRDEGFAPVELSFPAYDLAKGEESDPSQKKLVNAIGAIYKGIEAVNTKVDHLIKVQQVHTIAHRANIRATHYLRLVCLKDGAVKDKAYSNLIISMKSVILGSDPELKDLPFRSVSTTENFFTDINRIIKLAHFLLAFVEYDRSYTVKLLDTVFHIKLQRIIFWKSGTGNNG